MQPFSLEDNLHEMPNPVLEKNKKYYKMPTEIFTTEHAKLGSFISAINPCPAEPGYTLPLQTV